MLAVIFPEGECRVVLDEYLDEEWTGRVSTLYGLEEAGLSDADGVLSG